VAGHARGSAEVVIPFVALLAGYRRRCVPKVSRKPVVEWSNFAFIQLSVEWHCSQGAWNAVPPATWFGFVVALNSFMWHDRQFVDMV